MEKTSRPDATAVSDSDAHARIFCYPKYLSVSTHHTLRMGITNLFNNVAHLLDRVHSKAIFVIFDRSAALTIFLSENFDMNKVNVLYSEL